MVKNLIEAQNWAEGVRDCVSKVELWSCNSNHGIEKVQMKYVNKLLSYNPAPCNEPGHLKLKVKFLLRGGGLFLLFYICQLSLMAVQSMCRFIKKRPNC